MDLRNLAVAAGVGFGLAAGQSPVLAAGFTDINGLVTQFDVAGGGPTVGGSDPGSGNCYPFSCFASAYPVGGHIYQQVYSASSFAGPISIDTVSFFKNDVVTTDGNMDSASYDVSFWTTPRAVDGLVKSAGANHGTLLADFGSYDLGGLMPETLTLTGAAFNYDPSAGNLLMQVQVRGLTFAQPFQSFFEEDTSGRVTSRYWDYGRVGLPEPATWATMLLGAGMVGLCVRRRKALAAVSGLSPGA